LKCQASPIYFLKTYGKINDPERGIIEFEDWPFLVELLGFIDTHKELIILKARQLGISWLMAGYSLWVALFHEGSRVLLLSQGETEAADLLSKCVFMHLHLPSFLALEKGKDQSALITFPAIFSEIRALPSTEKAGHGYNASLVVRDELEHHPYASENFAAVGPAVDAGGKQIDLSTVNKRKLGTHFKTRYMQARSGENNAFPVFLPWHVRPGRTAEWFEGIKRKYPKWVVEQEYPNTEAEALGVLQAGVFFDADATDRMLLDCCSPVEVLHGGTVKIWKKPVVGRKYCIACDPSDGKEDPHAIGVMDWQTSEIVALSHGKVPADTAAQIYDELVRMYNNAFNTYELNARAGGIFSQKLKDLGTPNQAPFISAAGKLDITKTGWWTGPSNRNSMLWALEEAIRKNQIRFYHRDGINEIKMFQLPEGDDPQAPEGGHDDIVIMLAILWQTRKRMPSGLAQIKSFQMNQRW